MGPCAAALVSSPARAEFFALRRRSVPKFHFEIPHTLSAGECKSRMERFIEALETKFQDKVHDLSQAWNGNTLNFGFKTFGIRVVGDMTAHDQRLEVNGDLPFAAMMFKGKIETEMRDQLGRFLK
jgi:hypothetical protein